MPKPRVFILQEPLRRDDGGLLVPVMDFHEVIEYGDPVVCLGTGRVSLTPGPTVDRLKESLRDFTDDDYMVSVGDPTAIFIAAMIVGEANRGRCKCLKWDKKFKKYISIQIDLNYRKREGY